MTEALNPRYVRYATVHGRTPHAMMAHDEARYPGGRMTGFTLWIGRKKRQYERLGGALLDTHVWDQRDWDLFLLNPREWRAQHAAA